MLIQSCKRNYYEEQEKSKLTILSKYNKIYFIYFGCTNIIFAKSTNTLHCLIALNKINFRKLKGLEYLTFNSVYYLLFIIMKLEIIENKLLHKIMFSLCLHHKKVSQLGPKKKFYNRSANGAIFCAIQ